MSKHAWKVQLVPWDYTSPEHISRMHDQRVACGWRADEVLSWAESARKGGKWFYWVVGLSREPPIVHGRVIF
jgi:hypothetical protein